MNHDEWDVDDDFVPAEHLIFELGIDAASLAFWQHADGTVSLHVYEAEAPFATVFFLDRLQLVDLARGCLAGVAALEPRP